MTLPIYDNGVASGLLSGVLFGYVLENAGFASPRKLTAQFRFSDWSVFKVMFTAIIVAAIGLYAAMEFGLMRPNGIFIPTTFFWASLTGGALVGAGMAVGGYCPGTSTVGLATGRLDGCSSSSAWCSAPACSPACSTRSNSSISPARPAGTDLAALFGIPTWAVLAILIVVAIVGFALGTRLERAHGGPLTAEQLNGGEGATTMIERIDIVSVRTG